MNKLKTDAYVVKDKDDNDDEKDKSKNAVGGMLLVLITLLQKTFC